MTMVEKIMKKLPGVKGSSVNLATKKMKIQYDENLISLQDIQSAVDHAGYKAILELRKKLLLFQE